MATPEDWAAMQPFQDAIDQAHGRVMRLAKARDGVRTALQALRGEATEDGNPTPLTERTEDLLFDIRSELTLAESAARDAGARATAKWAELTGQHGSTRFVQ